jgi:protein-arginine kinase activator protein McsA
MSHKPEKNQQFRQMVLKAYCPHIYTVHKRFQSNKMAYTIEKSMHAADELNGAELFGCSELYTVLTQLSTNVLKDIFS